jgi:hypothetical protein
LSSALAVLDDSLLDGQVKRIAGDNVRRLTHAQGNRRTAFECGAGKVRLEPEFVSRGKHVPRQAVGIVRNGIVLVHVFTFRVIHCGLRHRGKHMACQKRHGQEKACALGKPAEEFPSLDGHSTARSLVSLSFIGGGHDQDISPADKETGLHDTGNMLQRGLQFVRPIDPIEVNVDNEVA